jgi:hypothetical protein
VRASPPPPDPRLAEPLRLMRSYAPTADWPDFLERYGVALRVAAVPGALAAFRASDRTLSVDPDLVGADPRAVATLLVHETVHAILDATGGSGKSGLACIDEEARAFAAQSAFWAAQVGPAGRPEPATALEKELNHTLAAAEDDALPALVISSFAYTVQCYVPGSTAPDDGE